VTREDRGPDLMALLISSIASSMTLTTAASTCSLCLHWSWFSGALASLALRMSAPWRPRKRPKSQLLVLYNISQFTTLVHHNSLTLSRLVYWIPRSNRM
jgi:hypothetical protein